MPHPVNWFQIQGPDARALQAFYARVFEWKMTPLPGPGEMKMVPPAPQGIPGGIGESMNKQPSVAVYVSVGDIDAYLGKVERAGGHAAMPRMELPNDMGAIGGFTDPAGNWIGLWEPSKKPSPATRRAAAAVKKTGAKKRAGARAPKKTTPKKSATKRAAKRR